MVGVQPQTLGAPPPPQVWDPAQAPHSSVPPQPSGMAPQSFPWAAQVVGAQQAPLGDWTWPAGQQMLVREAPAEQLPEQHWSPLEQRVPVSLQRGAAAPLPPPRPIAPSPTAASPFTMLRRERPVANVRAA